MAPKKLSESDKQDILSQYRQTEETTVTLASRYGVSTSTVSRILKQNLPEDEYEALVQQKRSGAFRSSVEQEFIPGMLEVSAPAASVSPTVSSTISSEPEPVATPSHTQPAPPIRRQRKRLASRLADEAEETDLSEVVLPQFDLALEVPQAAYEPEPNPFQPVQEAVQNSVRRVNDDFSALADEEDELEDDLEDELEDELEDDLEDDLEDELGDDLEDDELEDEEAEEQGGFDTLHIQSRGQVQVLPLSEAAIPRTCYVVVDRASELITRPLRDFADLGQIPSEENQEKTLPIFENHRVAKRFLRRMQRIVKVPDGRVFQKVSPYLQAKGITRLLIDGQVYSL